MFNDHLFRTNTAAHRQVTADDNDARVMLTQVEAHPRRTEEMCESHELLMRLRCYSRVYNEFARGIVLL